jgi:ParB family transcriptional regulator, chromosome partitioning protein
VTGRRSRERGFRPPVVEITTMTDALSKITLSASRNIPFNKLVLSQSNVRRLKAGIS